MWLSVVVCAKDEPEIADCLERIEVSDLIVIVADADTYDRVDTAFPLHKCWLIRSPRGSLPADRQLGAEITATSDFVAYIDADHRLAPGDLRGMLSELILSGVDVLQARLRITPRSFWNRAESEFLDMTMRPGVRSMVGVAPTIFRREVLDAVRFADGLSIDDTDFMYRLHRDTDFVTAVGHTVIECRHDPRLRDYLAKFRWYGGGDGAFMSLHPERRRSMLFHLLIRYPLLHPARALVTGRLRAIPYAVLQGLTRARYALL